MAHKDNIIEKTLNILVLLASIAILVFISIEILPISSLLCTRFILRFHLTICCIFLIDFLIRWYYSHEGVHFLWHNLIFLLVSIPYLNLIHSFYPLAAHPLWIFLRIIPVIRGIYGVSVIFSWLSRNRVTGLFATYVTFLFTTIYFCSIMFYFVEHDTNPQVFTYWNAFDWALMNVTTVGSNIYGVTKIGQFLAVVLAMVGMIFFPVFTAYIVSIFESKHKDNQQKDTQTNNHNKYLS